MKSFYETTSRFTNVLITTLIFKDSKMLVYIYNKERGKIVGFNNQTEIGFFNLPPYLIRLVLKSYKIPYLK